MEKKGKHMGIDGEKYWKIWNKTYEQLMNSRKKSWPLT
jgi:hypothetical protein